MRKFSRLPATPGTVAKRGCSERQTKPQLPSEGEPFLKARVRTVNWSPTKLLRARPPVKTKVRLDREVRQELPLHPDRHLVAVGNLMMVARRRNLRADLAS